MNHRERSAFEQTALASGLLTQKQLDEARAGIRWSEGDEPEANLPPTDKQLADRLVDMGLLNPWQAKQLLDGRTRFNLGPYVIIDSIGQGGMGQVFKARHDKIGRIVAVKVLPRDKSTPEAVANFMREIRALASLDHPQLVTALDAGEDGNVHYLVTEYVDGTDLRKLVRRDGPLSMSAAASIISQVAEGLAYAHSKGIVHRDVKPGNVLVSTDGVAKLSDLGLAGSLEGNAEDDPRHGKIVGTADYLSPDHVRDPWNPAPSWDIYSLGCTLYYAVTGKVPFPGGTTADKARAHCELRPLDPRRLNPKLTPEFVDVLADLMAKDPSHRIASAQEVIARLKPFLPQSLDLASVGSAAASRSVMPLSRSEGPTVPPPLRTGKPPAMPVIALADTISDLPAATAQVEEENHDAGCEVLEDFDLLEELNDPHVAYMLPNRRGGDLLAVLWPLTVFILAPLALVGTVILLWWLVRAVSA